MGEKLPGADVVMVMAEDPERTKKLTEPRALNLHLVKNREGKRATLALDFVSAFLPSPQLPGSRFGNAPTRPTTISEESYTA